MNMIVYNLEFPEYIYEMEIAGYKFVRLQNYEEAYAGMMWKVASSGSEFPTKLATGSHQATASVEEVGINAVLHWGEGRSYTKLDDICLILSLFTGRHVFALEERTIDSNTIIISDHRINHYGGILQCSIEYEAEFFNPSTLLTLTEKEKEADEFYYTNKRDIGFAKKINEIMTLISSDSWLKRYAGGYYLFLFRQALKPMTIEANFILCWTIWEHLFAVLNKAVYTAQQLERDVSGETKICYFLTEYFGLKLSRNSRSEVHRIVKARDRLVHYGIKPDDVDVKEMDLFIRATEYLVCMTLNLAPSNVHNTDEHLASFLKLRTT